MDISGKPNEGWMTVIPLSLFVFFVVVALGGPTAFMNIVASWAGDVVLYVTSWLKYL